MDITARDLARLIELNKKRAELQFQRDFLGAQTVKELALVESNAEEIRARAKAAGIAIMLPDQKKLDELNKALAKFTPDAIREGIKVKDGLAYQTLKERGIIVKRNFENRLEIAKLSILLCGMKPEERDGLAELVASGSLEGPIKAGSLDEEGVRRLARFLRRCGISCKAAGNELRPDNGDGAGEIRMQVANRTVWISEGSKAQLEENLKKMQDINAHIQLKNAERQIKIFDAEEEKHFATLQRAYLDLLKQQDELLKEFNAEERLTLKPHSTQ